MRKGFLLLREFISRPGMVGAVWPSSRALARRIVQLGRVSSAKVVVELGPGTGAFTREILGGLTSDASFLAVEKSECLARYLASSLSKRPGHLSDLPKVVQGCATRLADLLAKERFCMPDVVISGLPWAGFRPMVQKKILSQISEVLAPGGVFVTFAYFGPHLLRRGRFFRRLLDTQFEFVERSATVVANIPPAFVIRASKRFSKEKTGSVAGSKEPFGINCGHTSHGCCCNSLSIS